MDIPRYKWREVTTIREHYCINCFKPIPKGSKVSSRSIKSKIVKIIWVWLCSAECKEEFTEKQMNGYGLNFLKPSLEAQILNNKGED